MQSIRRRVERETTVGGRKAVTWIDIQIRGRFLRALFEDGADYIERLSDDERAEARERLDMLRDDVELARDGGGIGTLGPGAAALRLLDWSLVGQERALRHGDHLNGGM